jgi:hypothetical protein
MAVNWRRLHSMPNRHNVKLPIEEDIGGHGRDSVTVLGFTQLTNTRGLPKYA